jgi:capsular polysaccharide transport system permease protein
MAYQDAVPEESLWRYLDKHRRILWALLLRELATRYGRENIGFLWIIAEPLFFATAVSILWSHIRTPFENGIPIIPFVATGYLPLILVRQTIGYSVNAARANASLLYHRQITPLHLFLARIIIEFIGSSAAFVVIVAVLNIMGLMGLPKDFGTFLGGWLILAWMVTGMALIMGALGEIYEFIEKITQIITYIYIPLSGCFIMAATVAPALRKTLLILPFIHAHEMIRAGYFGEFIATYYNPYYAMAWAAGFTLLGLLLMQLVRSRVEVID